MKTHFAILFALILSLCAVPRAAAADSSQAGISPQTAALVALTVKAVTAKADSIAHDSATLAARDSAKTVAVASAAKSSSGLFGLLGGIAGAFLGHLGAAWRFARRVARSVASDPEIQQVAVAAAVGAAKQELGRVGIAVQVPAAAPCTPGS